MKINRNIFWTENFFDRLSDLGVKYICISPGSRSTALTLSASANKKFKCFVHIDERSSAFFALGLAKPSGQPVAVITTSGTAAAELYPAIIEAYQQRIRLIICTADRPPELIGRGANQTINQNNMYKNHIRFYENAGLPSVSVSGIRNIRRLAEKAYQKSEEGPVHINFPFRKPFEPGSYTDELNSQRFRLIKELKLKESTPKTRNKGLNKRLYKEILSSINDTRSGLIIAGPMKFNKDEKMKILKLSEKLDYPILADACSQLRFGNESKNIITNYEGFLKNSTFINSYNPDLVLQFGRTPSSKAIEIYIDKIRTKRYIINEYGDLFDPWNSTSGVFRCTPSLFIEMILNDTSRNNDSGKTTWSDKFRAADYLSQKEKDRTINHSSFLNECRIISDVINNLPPDTHIMISNSMPVRDFDYFAPHTNKEIIVHSNRGASGIDGILSTALGLKQALNKPALLITGDMAFYYDINALLTAEKYRIPLVVILINNNGGGIFGMLPVSEYGKSFREYFVSPHDLDFSSIIRSFSGKHKLIRNWDDLSKSLSMALKENRLTVLEVKTDMKISVNLRKKYFKGAGRIISRYLNED